MHNKRYDYKKVYKKMGVLIALVLVFVTFAVLVLGASKAVVRAEEEETYKKASYTNPDT
ncbi:unknown [Eubacterium sp. CAG:252]|nr:unknown [Eubacterium sp. CAG:252]